MATYCAGYYAVDTANLLCRDKTLYLNKLCNLPIDSIEGCFFISAYFNRIPHILLIGEWRSPTCRFLSIFNNIYRIKSRRKLTRMKNYDQYDS